MSDIRKKQVALGVEDFKEIIDKGGYFVDKTLMIQNLMILTQIGKTVTYIVAMH